MNLLRKQSTIEGGRLGSLAAALAAAPRRTRPFGRTDGKN